MKKQYSYFSTLIICVIALFSMGSRAYANDYSTLIAQIGATDAHIAKVEIKLGIDPQMVDHYQHATSYYDDLVDHYEQDQLMRDEIDKGIS